MESAILKSCPQPFITCFLQHSGLANPRPWRKYRIYSCKVVKSKWLSHSGWYASEEEMGWCWCAPINVPSKSLLSVRGMEGRVSSNLTGGACVRLKARYLVCLVNTYAVRGRTKVPRGGSRPAAQPHSLEGTLVPMCMMRLTAVTQ